MRRNEALETSLSNIFRTPTPALFLFMDTLFIIGYSLTVPLNRGVGVLIQHGVCKTERDGSGLCLSIKDKYIDLGQPKSGAPLFFWNVVTNENDPTY